jgi:hypothetical protein
MQRLLTLIAAVTLIGTGDTDEPVPVKGPKSEVDVARQTFGQEILRAREITLKRFDVVAQQIHKNPRLTASVRLSLIKELKQHKERFAEDGTWPDNPQLAAEALQYAGRLYKAYLPVAKVYERQIDSHMKAGDIASAEKCMQQRARLEETIRGDSFRVGSKWHGSRGDLGGSSLFTLEVKKLTDTVFEAEAHHNPGVPGHPIFEIRGVLSGNRLGCDTSRLIRGKGQMLKFDGFIIGNKMVLAVGGIHSDGKPVSGNLIWATCR